MAKGKKEKYSTTDASKRKETYSLAGSKTKGHPSDTIRDPSNYFDKYYKGVKFDDMHPDAKKAYMMERSPDRYSRNLPKKKKK